MNVYEARRVVWGWFVCVYMSFSSHDGGLVNVFVYVCVCMCAENRWVAFGGVGLLVYYDGKGGWVGVSGGIRF